MANNEIMVKDLSTTSSLSTDNKLMLLTDEANNRVQNITVENALANIISSNANNSLSVGSDKKLYTPDISGEVGDLDNLITTNKTDIVSAINEVKDDTNAITGEVVSASKGWLEEGKIYQKAYWYGEKIYNDVYSYNHSTFDVSKFTKVGSPIITDDGIASGFSFNDYFTSSFIPSSSMTSFDFIIGFTTGNDVTTSQAILGQVTSNRHTPQIEVLNGKARGVFALNSSTWGTVSGELNVQPNTHYILKFSWANQIIKSFQLVNGAWVQFGQDTAQATVLWDEVMKIGADQISAIFLGEIDLKEFSIFVDGYPAFLGNKTGSDTYTINNTTVTIPYTESSTGSKIVDVAYRDRVIDVYEQYGSANYYTIDETNQNCTLPMGEIYGFIRQSDSDKIYKDLVPCYDSTKAIIVPLLGHYTAPADGYVCSPNMVLVLDPDNGYENFSLTIMRNTQSMTMISCTGPTAFPFCLPVLKDDVLTLAADATVTSNVYFIPREGV